MLPAPGPGQYHQRDIDRGAQRRRAAEECAGAFLYLASDAASGYVTGQIIEVNGGQLMP